MDDRQMIPRETKICQNMVVQHRNIGALVKQWALDEFTDPALPEEACWPGRLVNRI